MVNFVDDSGCECLDLSAKTRLMGGVISSIVSFVFCWLSFIPFARGDNATFATIYTIGSLAGIFSSLFYAGFKKHIQKMKDMPHAISAACLIISFILVLVFGIKVQSKILVILALICQWVSTFFFYVTLFPGGFTCVKAVFNFIF